MCNVCCMHTHIGEVYIHRPHYCAFLCMYIRVDLVQKLETLEAQLPRLQVISLQHRQLGFRVWLLKPLNAISL